LLRRANATMQITSATMRRSVNAGKVNGNSTNPIRLQAAGSGLQGLQPESLKPEA
jgi:hypothetical protein